MPDLVVVYGTRPEAIKLGPIVAALRQLGVKPKVICTGQHTDLLHGTPAETDLYDGTSLGLASDGNVPRWLTHASVTLRRQLQELEDGSVVVIQGDTMSALAGCQAANAEGLRVAHVEAGVRSHDLDEPWPEELARVKIGGIAAWHYAPTSTAYANLLSEGVPANRIRMTGNPGVSAIARYGGVTPTPTPGNTVMVSLHRREWLKGPVVETLDGLADVAKRWTRTVFCWPMHPAVSKTVIPLPEWPDNVQIIEPLPYREMLQQLVSSFGIMTDSGGLIEEAATLGVPSIQLRRVTDRPEAIEAGVSARHDPTRIGIAQGAEVLLQGRLKREPTDIYGSIGSADEIARHLAGLV